jgi:hypothetical protein
METKVCKKVWSEATEMNNLPYLNHVDESLWQGIESKFQFIKHDNLDVCQAVDNHLATHIPLEKRWPESTPVLE